MGAVDPLQVWNKATGFDNNEFAPPSESGGSLDGPVDTAVPVPVTGDKIHICANHNTAVVHFGGTAREVEVFLHIYITRVR